MKSIVTLGLLLALGLFALASMVYTTTAAQGTTNYRQLARADATAVGIDPDIFERQINQESGFNPRALSPAGAEGIAQFMPQTAQGLGIDPYNLDQALKGAAQLMARYMQCYHSYALSLAAYNVGSGTVQYCLAYQNWYQCLPRETRNYIAVILEW